MKNVSSFINVDPNINSKVEEIKNKILKDKKLISYLNENKIILSEEKLNNSLMNLIQFSENNHKCINCEGLEQCKQQNKGFKPILKDVNNYINLQYIPCNYQKTYEAQLGIAENLKSFFMPKKVLNASFDNLDKNETKRHPAITKLASFASTYNGTNFIKGAYIYGPFGVGKTYLLASMANTLAKRNIKVAFVYFPDLIRELKSSLGNNNFESLLGEIKNIQVLIFDDIGAEMNTSWMRDEILGPILQYRLLQELPTFFSSNKSIDELIKYYSRTNDNIIDETKAERIGDRIKALTNEIAVTGKNYRY